MPSTHKLSQLRLFLLATVALVLFGIIAVFGVPIFGSSKTVDKATYLSVIITALTILTQLGFSFIHRNDTKSIDQVRAKLRSGQNNETRTHLNALRKGVGEDLILPIRSSMGERVDIDQIISTLIDKNKNVVLLGSAGSGKTYTALQAARRISEIRQDLIPVIVSVSDISRSYDGAGSFCAYLGDLLSISSSTAQKLISEGVIIPIYDSLDEVEVESAVGTVQSAATNFISSLLLWQSQDVAAKPFILTSRRPAWQALPEAVRNNYRLEVHLIQSVTSSTAARFMSRTLFHDENLQLPTDFLRAVFTTARGGAHSPWWISMVIRITQPWLDGPKLLPGAAEHVSKNLDQFELIGEFIFVSALRGSGRFSDRRRRLMIHRLATYARYLDTNKSSSRILAGRLLPTSDLELHRLWPITGDQRARVTDFLLCISLSAPGLLWVVTTIWPLGIVGRLSVVIFVAVYMLLLVRTSTKIWVQPAVLNPGQRPTMKQGVLQTATALILGSLGIILFSPLVGALCFACSWFAIGWSVGFGQTLVSDDKVVTSRPCSILQDERSISRRSAWILFPVLVFAFSYSFGPASGVLFAALYCLVVGETVASALWRRYLAMILCRPLSLPLQPRAFFESCKSAGLIRSSGLTYQFRHEAIRDYLATAENKILDLTDGKIEISKASESTRSVR